MLRWPIIAPGLTAAFVFGLVAVRMNPPAPEVALRCVVATAALLMIKLFGWVGRDGAGFHREERLVSFVSFAAIIMVSYAAQQAIAEVAFDYRVAIQKQELEEGSRDLSREILSFVEGRRHGAPPRPSPATWDQDEERWTEFENEMAGAYNERFAARVRVAHDLMSLRNMRDRDLDAFYRSPVNDFQMTIVAERLALLADRLEREGRYHRKS
jgi:hypothetical protein